MVIQDKPVDDSLFDNILDTNLSDIADLPEYLDYAPHGGYLLEIVEAEKKAVEVDKEGGGKMDAPVIQVTYEVVDALELNDPTEVDKIKTRTKDRVGSRFNESFFFHKDPKQSSEVFKAKYKEIASKFGTATIGDTLGVLKGLQISCTVKSKESRKEKGRFFIQTSNIQPV